MMSLPIAARADGPPAAGASSFTFVNGDGGKVFVRRWIPEGTAKAVVFVVHGLAEHSGRYDRFARVLNAAGYAVYAPDNRGHGRTALPGKLGDGGPDAWN